MEQKVPLISDILLNLQKEMDNFNIKFTEDLFNELYEEVIKRESGINIQISNLNLKNFSGFKFNEIKHKNKEKKKFKINLKCFTGFLEVIGGCVLAVIPPTHALGKHLVIHGFVTMGESLAETHDENKKLEEEERKKKEEQKQQENERMKEFNRQIG